MILTLQNQSSCANCLQFLSICLYK